MNPVVAWRWNGSNPQIIVFPHPRPTASVSARPAYEPNATDLDAQQKVKDAPAVCLNAFRLMYGLGKGRFKSSKDAAAAGRVPDHGLKGRKSNAQTDRIADAKASLKVFFEELETESDDEQEGHCSMRALYKRWAFERGWIVKFDATAKASQTERPVDGEQWTDESEQKPIVSWPTFKTYWDNHQKSTDVSCECIL